MMKIIFKTFWNRQIISTQLKDFSDWREYSEKVMSSLLLLSILANFLYEVLLKTLSQELNGIIFYVSNF